MFRLRAFGGLALERDGAPYVGPASQRRRLALLLVLASAPNGVSRDRLMSYLWPDADPERVRHSLDDALSALRRELGRDDLFFGVGTLRLNHEAIESDLADYAAAQRAGDFERALALYAGPLADGFYVPGAGELERWTESERRRRAQEHLRALDEAAAEAARRGDIAGEVRWRQALVAADPLSTPATLQLLRALSALGNVAEVRRIARVHEALLRDELGAPPGPGFDAEIERLVSEASAPVAGPTVRKRPHAADGEDVAPTTDGESPPAAPRAPSVSMPPAAGALGDGPRAPLRHLTRRTAVAAVLVGALSIGFLAFGWWSERQRAPSGVPRVLVTRFENATGDTALGPLSGMLEDWVRQGLAQTGIVDVIAGESGLEPARRGETGLRAAAAESRASVVVAGMYYREGDSLRLQPRLIDVERWALLRPIAPVSVPIGAPSSALEPARQRIVAALAVTYDPRFAGWEMGTPPPTYEAYEQYLTGVDLFARGEPARALPHWARAAALDSTYAQPILHSVDAFMILGRIPTADSLLHVLERRRGSLTPFERAAMDRARGMVDGNHLKALVAARAAAHAAPGAQVPHFLHAVSAFRANRPREALEAAARVSSFRQIDRGEPVLATVWQGLVANSRHMLGDYVAELETVRALRVGDPENAVLRALELRSLAALGRLADIRAILERTGPAQGGEGFERQRVPFILWELDEELEAHRHPQLAREVLLHSIGALRRRAEEQHATSESRFALARALYRAGSFDEAQAELSALETEQPVNARQYVVYQALIAARRGRRDDAARLAKHLLTLQRPYDFGWTTYARARIAAQMGENELALSLLRRAFEEGMFFGPALHADRELEPLRRDAGFRELLVPKG